MSRKVIVHVGAPKTGTSFVQDLLFKHRDQLAERGVLYPADRFDEHFLAALDLMELRWGGLETQAVGAWERLAERVRAWEGTVVISHEILATATREQVRRALASFGDSEVHVVMSARDLVRQIPAEWQENVKHRRVLTYRTFLDAITAPSPEGEVASWFWGVQEVPAVLDRWGRDLPPERVHLVTVPQPGAPRTLLWERFAQVFGLDPAELDTAVVERSNPSLGVAETALVRAINTRVNGGVLANEHYREFVRELLAHRTLSHRDAMDRLVLPPDVRPWAEELCEQWVETLSSRGYDVVGSLDDLRPLADATPYVDPDSVTPEQRDDATMHAIVALLTRSAELRGEVDGLHARLDEAHAERDAAMRALGLLARAKRKAVRGAERTRLGSAALQAYRRAHP